MAFKLKEQKIVPGGLNLLAPGDQVAEGACLDLMGWWAGSAGRLEQAPNLAVKNSPLVFSTQDSICQADGRIYYGGGGNLRQIGRGVNDAAIDTGYNTTYPLSMISYQGSVWVMNQGAGKQRKDDGTTVSDWTPSAPGAATLADGGVDGSALIPAVGNPPEVGGLLAQQYTYYVTWQLGTLGETNPSTGATITPAVDGSIVRITQPGSAPATATGWNIFRKGPNLITPYRLNEFTLAIARTYVDDYGDAVHTHSDDDLLSLGIIMETDHDAAPACRVMANQVYNGRIVVANSSSYPNRIWYTPALQPAFFRGSGDANSGDWVDIGTDKGDEILAMTVRPGMVIIYRSRSIWRHVGDFGDLSARIECVVPDMGVVGVHAVAPTSLGDYFVWNDGVYKFNNDWAQKISTTLDPLFRGETPESVSPLDTTKRAQHAIGFKNGRLWVSYPVAGSAASASIIYHVDSQRWFNEASGYGAFLDTGVEFLGAGAGIYSLESTYSGGSTTVAFQSEYQDCGLPDREKTWADLVLHHNTQGKTVTIIIRTNKYASSANDSFTLTTFSSSVLTKQVIPLVYPAGYAVVALRGKPIRSYSLSVRLTSTSGATPIIIDSPILLHYYVEARKGMRFDTSLTDHGTEDVKIVDQVEVDIDATAGAASLQVSSDIPGGTLTARLGAGQAITATTGRESRRMVLSAAAIGRLLRYEITTTTAQQIYGLRARMLRVGVYLDGTVGDVWEPTPISIGV